VENKKKQNDLAQEDTEFAEEVGFDDKQQNVSAAIYEAHSQIGESKVKRQGE
jgi:hypothetical protein